MLHDKCLKGAYDKRKYMYVDRHTLPLLDSWQRKITFFNEYDYQLHCYRSHMMDKTVFKSAALPQNMLGAARCLVEFFEYLSLSGGFFFLVGRWSSFIYFPAVTSTPEIQERVGQYAFKELQFIKYKIVQKLDIVKGLGEGGCILHLSHLKVHSVSGCEVVCERVGEKVVF